MPFALALHVLAAVIWVGGMFFAYMALRPAAGEVLEPAARVRLWSRTLAAFFRWVWVAVVVLLLSGYWMIFAGFGGMAAAPPYVHTMQALGIVMMLLYLHVYFAPYRRLRHAVAQEDTGEAARRLDQVRKVVALNLALGLITLVVASGGRYLA